MKKRVISLILIIAMALGMLSACGNDGEQVQTVDAPLVVGYTSFNEVFSPFYAKSAADKDVVSMTQVNLLTVDREGAVVYNAIDGETRSYNDNEYTYYGIADINVKAKKDGTVVYDITLRDDVKFSDGEVLNAEDLIFTMYVLCDPLYEGPYALGKAPIVGLEEYQSSMVSLFDALVMAGKNNTNYTLWDQTTQDAFWAELETAGTQFAQDIVDYLAESSGTTSVAEAAKLWGYSGLSEQSSTTDFFYRMCEKYAWDLKTLNKTECVGKSLFTLMENYDAYAHGVQLNLEVTKIEGIEMTGEYSVRITMDEQNAANIQYLDIPVVPMHYYGNPSLFQYESDVFGFVKGDLSLLDTDAQHTNKGAVPMGAGPYVFVPSETEEEESTKAYEFHANPNYYLGQAKTENIQFVEISSARKINGIVNAKIDLTDVSMTKKVAENIEEANLKVVENAVALAAEEGIELDVSTIADAVSYTAYDYAGYGYIGMNANLMNVKGDPDSNASKNLRKALATLFAVYRDEVITNYFSEHASVIDYPVSNVSWTAPEKGSKGYKSAFVKNVKGKSIYTEEMSQEERYEAAKEAALGYFKAAGYAVEGGIIKSAPEGAAMSYEVYVAGNGLGEHPSYMILLDTKAALAELGINLVIRDVKEEKQMWAALSEGTCAIWLAAWDAAADPDVYDMYHPDGAYAYMYGIDDDTLSGYLEEARKISKQSTREKLYKKSYDIVLDWAVEVPVYQKQDGIIYSDTRVKKETLTADMTAYYGWLDEIHNIEMFDLIIEEAE